MKEAWFLGILIVSCLLIWLLHVPLKTGIIKKTKKSHYKNYHLTKLPEYIPTEYEKLYQKQDLPFLPEQPKIDIKYSKVYRDPHDNLVQSALSKKYKEITKEMETIKLPNEKTDAEKLGIIKSFYKDPVINEILDKIYTRNTNMILYKDQSEFDILWKAFSTGNNNVKSQLGIVLHEIQREGLKCPTGNVSRILEASFIDKPECIPLEKKDLQQVLLMKAAQLRNNHSPEETRNVLIQEYQDIYSDKKIREIIDSWGTDW